jgi:NIPSNAP
LIACHVRYVIDPYKIGEFEVYAKLWLRIVPRLGGVHHGYFLPGEGANNIAIAIFSFANLAAYEEYRLRVNQDAECQAAFDLEKRNRSILSYERSFMRPLLGLASIAFGALSLIFSAEFF